VLGRIKRAPPPARDEEDADTQLGGCKIRPLSLRLGCTTTPDGHVWLDARPRMAYSLLRVRLAPECVQRSVCGRSARQNHDPLVRPVRDAARNPLLSSARQRAILSGCGHKSLVAQIEVGRDASPTARLWAKSAIRPTKSSWCDHAHERAHIAGTRPMDDARDRPA
jgi:hypothetical protein